MKCGSRDSHSVAKFLERRPLGADRDLRPTKRGRVLIGDDENVHRALLWRGLAAVQRLKGVQRAIEIMNLDGFE